MDSLYSAWETIKEKKHKVDLFVARKIKDWLIIKDPDKPKNYFVMGDPFLGDPKVYEMNPQGDYF